MSASEKLSVTIDADSFRAIRESVEAGDYASVNDAVQDSLRLWQRERMSREDRLCGFRTRVQRSLNDSRPDLSPNEVDAALEALFADPQAARRRA